MDLTRPTLYLLRGLPGAGKTSLANALAPEKGLFAADDYFTSPEGEYDFRPAELGEAHAQCQKRTAAALAAGEQHIAVHNTFTQRWELEPYLDMLVGFPHYDVVVVDLYDGGKTDAELCDRNSHGVPIASIEAMRARWEHDWKAGNPTPPWERG